MFIDDKDYALFFLSFKIIEGIYVTALNMICVLLKLNSPLKMITVTSISYFYSWSVHFSKYS